MAFNSEMVVGEECQLATGGFPSTREDPVTNTIKFSSPLSPLGDWIQGEHGKVILASNPGRD